MIGIFSIDLIESKSLKLLFSPIKHALSLSRRGRLKLPLTSQCERNVSKTKLKTDKEKKGPR